MATTAQRRWFGFQPRPCIVNTVSAMMFIALAVLVVSHITVTARRELLYYDGDSVLPALIRGSIAVGQPQNWALSPVLFVPEVSLYLALSWLNMPQQLTLTLNAVLNILMLFASFRLLSSFVVAKTSTWGRTLATLVCAIIFTLLCSLESSSSRNGLELATLIATTTYYSATLIAGVLAFACTMALVHHPAKTKRRQRFAVLLLFVIVAVSVWTNPIFVAWTIIPTLVLLGSFLVLPGALRMSATRAGVPAGVLVLGTAGGLALRVFAEPWIAISGSAYIQPHLADVSLRYYWALVVSRIDDASGILELTIVGACIICSLIGTVIGARRGDQLGTMLAVAGWLTPVLVVGGAIALGTEAARYLQPAFLAPVLGMMIWVRWWHPRSARRERRVTRQGIFATSAVVLTVCATATVPGLIGRATHLDPSIVSLDAWISQSGRTGAGQYWTIRGPKAYLPDGRQLIQIDGDGNGYDWLVNSNDFSGRGYSFIVADAAAPVPSVPVGTPTPSRRQFGRYTVFDYGSHVIPLGPGHH